MLTDIRQEYLHAQNLSARSRTPPTPTFPSENFDLPPITPPGSLQTHSTFPVGQQPLRMALLSTLNRSATVRQQLPSFVQPNLPPPMNNVSMNQQLVGESMGEGSNIEQLIDEIVERDMPQGVTEPIVFAPQASQQQNSSTDHLQIASNTLQKGISPVSGCATSPELVPVVQTSSTSGKSTLPLSLVTGGSPLNSASSPGSPLASSRSPSPKVKQANPAGKVSAPVRSASQAIRLTPPAIQPSSPLQAVGGLSASQSAVIAARPFSSHTGQLLTNSQMLQMAVPSAVVSSMSQTGSSLPHMGINSPTLPPGNKPAKSNGDGAIVNPQGSRVILSSSSVHSSSSQMQGHNIATHNVGVSVQSSVKHDQMNPLQALASNPELLGQLVKAIGQPKQQVSSGQAVTTKAGIQTGQPLICYVVPQNSASGAQVSQAKASISLTASNQPVKMILVNANSPLKSPVSLKPQQSKMTVMKPTTIGFNSKSTLSSLQSAESKDELEAALNPSFKNVSSFVETNKMAVSGVKSELIMSQSNAAPCVQMSLAQTETSMQQTPPGLLVKNPNNKHNSITLGSVQSNTVPLLQTPLSSGNNVVQITFVNEATAISQVVAASPSSTLSSLSGGGHIISAASTQSSLTRPAENLVLSPQTMPGPTTEDATPASQQDSDDEDDEDDSTPLSQVAENLKKEAGSDDVKKKKKKKKEKGTKRKKREKERYELNK